MYRLSKLMLMSEPVSVISALLYTINPASIFFSTLYSESFYSLLLISALVCLAEGHYIRGCLILSLTTACRSNGIVNCGFACFPHFIFLINELSDIYKKKICIFFAFVKVLKAVLYRILIFFSIIGSSLLPYLIYQYYAGYLYCFTELKPSYLSFLIPKYPNQELVDYAKELGVLTPYAVNATVHAVWCQGVPWSSYNLLQKYFWNVGAFRYYQLRQLPNFLLALPVLTLVFKTISLFAKRAPRTLFSLGILSDTEKQRLILPHIYHILFLSLYGIVCVHIQVLTRMLFSSCPVLYWYCASVLLEEEDYIFTRVYRNTKSKPKKGIKIHGLDDMHQAVSPSTYPTWYLADSMTNARSLRDFKINGKLRQIGTFVELPVA
nr:gpi mannosyltransferase 2 [Hymenolepis microstoma]